MPENSIFDLCLFMGSLRNQQGKQKNAAEFQSEQPEMSNLTKK